MQRIIAEIQELGALDPAARDELLANLSQTDPQLWPLLAQRMRADLALRRQMAQRNAAASDAVPPATATSPAAIGPPASRAPARPPQSTSRAPGPAQPLRREPPHPAYGAQVAQAGHVTAAPPAAPEQPAARREPPPRPPRETGPSRDERRPADRLARRTSPDSDAAASAPDARLPLEEAIRQLEAEVAASPESDRQFAEHARLRMLYLLSGQRDEALRPIPSMSPSMQAFWSEQFYGLAALLDCDLISEPSRRKAEAKQHFDAAVAKLAESCPLVVRNLAFVTDIQSYGTYKPFEKYEFVPGQRLLLYAEVENFKTVETAKGCHAATRSSYQIFDSSGKRVAEHESSPSEEHCRRPRRDFFIGYEFCLPERIYPGKHSMQLTVADLNSQKIGQSVIEFTIKPEDE
jgi:hypothetical protein